MSSEFKPLQGTLLAIDTSTSSMSVALTRGGELLGELNSNAERNHSLHLVPHIQQVLASAGLHSRDVDAFAVGVGPGSYTGVRIGVTVAKTLAWTHHKVLLGVSSLEALALGCIESYKIGNEADRDTSVWNSVLAQIAGTNEIIWVVPMFEARRGQAFTGLYQVSSQHWSCLVSDGIRLVSAWTDELLKRAMDLQANERPSRILFTGQTELHEETLQKFFRNWTGPAEITTHDMRARHIADLGRHQWQLGHVQEPHGLVPNYTQLTEAEVKWEAQKSQEE
jgi:tRNA threonylcarbamoyladenosine biosynthesis protein TsaB